MPLGFRKGSLSAGAFYVSLAAIAVAGISGYEAWTSGSQAVAVDAATEADAHELGALPKGTLVIVSGTLDPAMEKAARNLSIYVMETYRKDGSRSSSYRWHRDASATPSFAIQTPRGSVRVTDDAYDIDRGVTDEAGEATSGSVRYRGFAPGDQLLVLGSVADGGVDAERLFAGTRAEYRAFLAGESGADFRLAQVSGAAGILGLAALLVFRRRLIEAEEPVEEATV